MSNFSERVALRDMSNPGSGKGRDGPIFIESDAVFSKDHFVIPPHYSEDVSSVMLSEGTIVDRIERLAADIHAFYGSEEIHLLCVLKGSRGFFNHLMAALNRIHMFKTCQGTHPRPPYVEHYVRVKSYSGTSSTGQVQVIADDLSMLKGKNVLIVEDIIDTGLTLAHFCDYLKKLSPRTIGVAALTEKRTPKSNGFKADFVGFSIPDEFIVGFGLDYNEYFRDLPHICVISSQGIQRFSVETLAAEEAKRAELSA